MPPDSKEDSGIGNMVLLEISDSDSDGKAVRVC